MGRVVGFGRIIGAPTGSFKTTWMVGDHGLVSQKEQHWPHCTATELGAFLLRGNVEEAPWAKAIWTSRSIPRQSFHAWLVVQNRIPTRDRLIGWGLQVPPLCLLCNIADESRDHIYWDCRFSFDLWSMVASRCRLNPQRNWETSLAQMISLPPPSTARSLTLLGWQATLYWTWNERNNRPRKASEMMQLWFR